MILLVGIACFFAGVLATLAQQRATTVLALRREARSRCGWCGRRRAHKPGQSCDECQRDLSTLKNERGGWTAAAPADWPKA